MNESTIKITILKWEKHNANKKSGHGAMLVKTDLRDNPKLLRVPVRARLLYFWLLLKSGSDTRAAVEYLPSQSRGLTGLKPSEHHDALAALEQEQLLRIENCDSSYIKEKKRKESNSEEPKKPEQPLASQEFDFETIAKEWPIKSGRSLGIKRLRSREWDFETCKAFSNAARRYASECRMQRRDPKYIKHFSTFVGTAEPYPWRDYHESERVKAPPLEKTPINEPEFDPVDTSAIKNPHARKLLNLVTNNAALDERRRPNG